MDDVGNKVKEIKRLRITPTYAPDPHPTWCLISRPNLNTSADPPWRACHPRLKRLRGQLWSRDKNDDYAVALERAKEAGRKERAAVLFNLANQYSANEMYNEALDTYGFSLTILRIDGSTYK
uniref:Uncharacterized protein n=1 Tax=Romanomermis culicivorax TaxID=13658 RepID=A0A915KFL5_ROMCU